MNLQEKVQALAAADGSTVLIGCHPGKSDFFVKVGDWTESWGATPEAAVDAAIASIIAKRQESNQEWTKRMVKNQAAIDRLAGVLHHG